MSAALPVNRVQRRRMILQSRGAPIEFGQLPQEARSRVARKVRCYLMQLRAVALVAPRWSDPSTFLEEIAADLFPAIRCQIVSARSMVGRTEREAWNFLLHALNHLSFEGADTRPVPMVIDERGFETAVEQALYLASQEDIPTALVIQNAEHLPVQTLEMLGRKWVSQQTFNRCTLLVSASVATPALSLTEGPWIELEDFTEQESIRRLQQRSGTAPQELIRSAARFSGGIPSLVDVIADSLRQNRWPTSRGGWIEVLGEFTDELKAAVQVALASTDLADRLHRLEDGRQWAMEPGDRTLLLSGLLRRMRAGGAPRVQIRAPALAQMAGVLEPRPDPALPPPTDRSGIWLRPLPSDGQGPEKKKAIDAASEETEDAG